MEKKPSGEVDAGADTNQKSDKSPQELMQEVAKPDDSLNSPTKQSSVDELANQSTVSKPSEADKKPQGQGIVKKVTSTLNIYAQVFILLLVVAVGVFLQSYFRNKQELSPELATTELTEETLEKLKTSDATVGDPRQILTIESHAIISGKAVLRDTLDVAGGVNIGGSLNVPSIQSAGAANFASVQTNDLQAAGNAAVGGLLDVAGALSVGQSLSVAGKISGAADLEIAGQATIKGDLIITGNLSAAGFNFATIGFTKINATGPPPSISAGGAAGTAATASISGGDLAGTASINTGTGTGTGVLATITFSSAYADSPHIVITPNGPACAAIDYYITNIGTSQFSIATASAPPTGSACRFNYVVIN